MEKKGSIVYTILIVILFLSLGAISIGVFYESKILKFEQEGLTKIEYIHIEVQRLSKFESEGDRDEGLIDLIDQLTNDFASNDNSKKYFSKDMDMIAVSNGIINNWQVFKVAIEDFRNDGDRDEFFKASELNYSNSEDTIGKIKKYVENIEDISTKYKFYAFLNVLIIAILFFKILFNTHTELQENKEISKDMYIDSATGVYNSLKCQELLKTPIDLYNLREVAILIFDLNDLKKTNDTLGHQAGDQLISSFAQQLKDASLIFDEQPFIGRYGGDEFVVYLNKITEEKISEYINNVNNLMDKLNQNESKLFTMSCAVGYSITTSEAQSVTMQALFDVADADMYKNKIAMKEQKKLEK